ncbi:MAG: YigZ family protein [Spirochaetota bacterium]
MRVPTASCRNEWEVKKSKFISVARPLNQPDEAKELVLAARNEHPQASHVVYAYLYGESGDQFGMSDDHEPKHTAGRPVLEVLKGSGLTNIIVLVIRYFGGTKLGTGGLVKAYTKAAQAVVSAVPSEELVSRKQFFVTIPYDLYQPLRSMLEECQADMITEQFGTRVTITGRIPDEHILKAQEELRERSSGGCSLKITD